MSRIPEKFRKYYNEFSNEDAINYTGVENERELFEMYSSQNLKNLKATHLGWAMAKDGYIEVLSELGLEFAEVLQAKDGDIMLGFLGCCGDTVTFYEIKLSLLEEFFV